MTDNLWLYVALAAACTLGGTAAVAAIARTTVVTVASVIGMLIAAAAVLYAVAQLG